MTALLHNRANRPRSGGLPIARECSEGACNRHP